MERMVAVEGRNLLLCLEFIETDCAALIIYDLRVCAQFDEADTIQISLRKASIALEFILSLLEDGSPQSLVNIVEASHHWVIPSISFKHSLQS